jgi:hypothetical protein
MSLAARIPHANRSCGGLTLLRQSPRKRDQSGMRPKKAAVSSLLARLKFAHRLHAERFIRVP